MARYMVLWEVDTSRTPEDPKAKKAQHLNLQEVVKKNLKEGVIKDWGLFAGEWCGYVMVECDAVELQTYVSMWVPFCRITATKQLMTIDEVNQSTKALPE